MDERIQQKLRKKTDGIRNREAKKLVCPTPHCMSPRQASMETVKVEGGCDNLRACLFPPYPRTSPPLSPKRSSFVGPRGRVP
jgi:hypothetical protein